MPPLIGTAPVFHRSDRRLWLAAVGISAAFNGLLLYAGAIHAFSVLTVEQISPLPPVEDSVMVIVPEMLRATGISAPEAKPAPPPQPEAALASFARTLGDQASERSVHPKYIGERDTSATSDTTPDPSALEVPAQTGIQPKHGEIETTEGDYQDGSLAHNRKTRTSPPDTARASTLSPAEKPATPASPAPAGHETPTPGEQEKPAPAISKAPDQLAQSATPVDVSVQKQTGEEGPKPHPEARAKEGKQEKPETKAAAELPKPTPPDTREAGFRGNQRKTAVLGSISRTGRSALDVANSPLGRYQAALSRAVESEWQRNCIRRRDFITPGFQTVRFLIGPNGKVRSVNFLEVVGGSEIQKGITLNSIREAAIPPMPDAVREELGNQPMELIYRFYF